MTLEVVMCQSQYTRRAKQSKAMATSLSALRHDHSLAWNLLQQLEHDFLIYGKYNVEKLQDIVMTVN